MVLLFLHWRSLELVGCALKQELTCTGEHERAGWWPSQVGAGLPEPAGWWPSSELMGHVYLNKQDGDLPKVLDYLSQSTEQQVGDLP